VIKFGIDLEVDPRLVFTSFYCASAHWYSNCVH